MPPLNHHHLIEGPGGINQVKQAGAYYSKLPIYSPTIGSVDGNLSLISPSKISLLVGGSDVLDITSLGLQIKGPYGLQLTAGAGTGKVLTSDAQGNASWQTASSGTASPLTTKGDLYTYSTTNARLGVGVDGQILIADSTQPTGLKWGAAPASGMSAVSIASTNGLAGTSSGGSTPILTLSTTITGLLKGNGTAISAAVAGTDYLTPTGNGSQLTGLTEGQVANLSSDLAAKAPLASPSFTGSPTAPTPTASGGVATKGYVDGTKFFKMGTVSVSVTGNIAITGLGFTPKIIHFYPYWEIAAGSSANAVFSSGIADSSLNMLCFAMASRNSNGGGTHHTGTACIDVISIAAGGGSYNHNLTGTIVSMDPDGFTVNISLVSAGQTIGFDWVAEG